MCIGDFEKVNSRAFLPEGHCRGPDRFAALVGVEGVQDREHARGRDARDGQDHQPLCFDILEPSCRANLVVQMIKKVLELIKAVV